MYNVCNFISFQIILMNFRSNFTAYSYCTNTSAETMFGEVIIRWFLNNFRTNTNHIELRYSVRSRFYIGRIVLKYSDCNVMETTYGNCFL